MRVCVLGHQGMLGHVVVLYLREQGCTVNSINTRFTVKAASKFIENILQTEPDWCINCIGLSPKQNISAEQQFEINALLPECLAKLLPTSVKIVQPSTDGVFRPDLSDRTIYETPDALDSYGKSKIYAENIMKQNNCFIIRCSIIGPEITNNYSLMSWFLSTSGTVNGYTNHHWNGITSLEWAKFCFQGMKNSFNRNREIMQPCTYPAITKYDLLKKIQSRWQHQVKIIPTESRKPVLRTLSPSVTCASLGQQLDELKLWYKAIS